MQKADFLIRGSYYLGIGADLSAYMYAFAVAYCTNGFSHILYKNKPYKVYDQIRHLGQ